VKSLLETGEPEDGMDYPKGSSVVNIERNYQGNWWPKCGMK